MTRATRNEGREEPLPRAGWANSRARLIYNLVMWGLAAAWGLALALAPRALGATPELRPWGAVLAGYGVIRCYYVYRRLRARPRG
ncbi:MAG: hypothetical protein HY321_05695 [Armatimonadetes bacterium]|nr:hypothetical protein [Armatimonadota bacterium]